MLPEEAEAVQVLYKEALVRAAVRTFVWRRFFLEQKLLWAATGAMLVLFAWLLSRGDRSWTTILAGATPLLALLFVIAGWWAHLRAKLRQFRAMPELSAKFLFNAEGFHASSAIGEMSLPWSAVTEVWAGPSFWMLLIAPNQFVTMPTQNVPAVTFERLRRWLGAKVIDL